MAAGKQDALHYTIMRHLTQASLPDATGGVCNSGLVSAAVRKVCA